MVHLFYNQMMLFCLNQARCRDRSSVAVALITIWCYNSNWPSNGCLPRPISGPRRESRRHGSPWRSPGRSSRCCAAAAYTTPRLCRHSPHRCNEGVDNRRVATLVALSLDSTDTMKTFIAGRALEEHGMFPSTFDKQQEQVCCFY
jgi:hypothetical protein